MYQQTIVFSSDSFLEISTRIFNGQEQVTLTLVGPKNRNELTASQAILTDAQVKDLIGKLQDCLGRQSNWPPVKES